MHWILEVYTVYTLLILFVSDFQHMFMIDKKNIIRYNARSTYCTTAQFYASLTALVSPVRDKGTHIPLGVLRYINITKTGLFLITLYCSLATLH